MPAEIRKNVELWIGCIAGAMEESEYRAKLAGAGFEGIEVEPTRVYKIEDARQFLTGKGMDVESIAPQVEDKFASAFIRAKKPSAGTKAAPQRAPSLCFFLSPHSATYCKRHPCILDTLPT